MAAPWQQGSSGPTLDKSEQISSCQTCRQPARFTNKLLRCQQTPTLTELGQLRSDTETAPAQAAEWRSGC